VPLRATVCVAAPSPPPTLRLAVFDPAAAGVKMILIVQAAPAATEVPQVLVSPNNAALVPVNPMLVMGSVNAPLLVRVTICAADATFVCTFPNATVAGDIT
jgi:hypothetical protein